MKLTDKQEKFCKEYMIDLNATQAAIRAGYSKKTANVTAYEYLSKPSIQERISELKKKTAEKLEITHDDLARELYKIAFSSISHLHNTWIELKDFENLTEDQKACIESIDTKIETRHEYNPEKDKKEPITVRYVKIKLYSKLKAIEELGKHIGFYEKDNEQKTQNSVIILPSNDRD